MNKHLYHNIHMNDKLNYRDLWIDATIHDVNKKIHLFGIYKGPLFGCYYVYMNLDNTNVKFMVKNTWKIHT